MPTNEMGCEARTLSATSRKSWHVVGMGLSDDVVSRSGESNEMSSTVDRPNILGV